MLWILGGLDSPYETCSSIILREITSTEDSWFWLDLTPIPPTNGYDPLHVDSTMTDFAESALAASVSSPPSPPADHVASGQDGDNKFQKAISAWRSESLMFRRTSILVLIMNSNRPYLHDPVPWQYRFRNCSISEGLHRAAQGIGTKDEGFPEVRRHK